MNIGPGLSNLGPALTILIPAIGAIVTVSVVYLKLFLKSEMNDLKDTMLKSIDDKFQGKEIARLEMNEVKERLRDLERRMGGRRTTDSENQ